MAGRSGSGRAGARFGTFMRRCAGGLWRFSRVWLRVHVADEAQALARDGADQLLVLAAVADRLARGVDAAGQRRIRHDPAAPDRSNQIVLADDAVAVLHQVNQQIEHLRLDRNGLGAAAQFAPIDVKRMIGKEKLHVGAPEPDCEATLKE